MAETPDLIVLGGDYVTWGDRDYVGPSAEALAPLAAPHGVFGILGNHDDDHDMPAALGEERRADAEGRAHAADDQERDDRSGRHPVLDEAPAPTSPR